MRRSLKTFFKGSALHIIAVPRKDLVAFRRALPQGADLALVAQEDMVDSIFYPDRLYRMATRFARSQLWRLESHAGRPGWIIQQIAKLNCTKLIEGGAIIFLDSDLIFFRPFDLSTLGIEQARLLLRIEPEAESSKHRHHVAKARELLALPTGPTEQHYMGYPTIWYADWVSLLHRHLEKVSGTSWQEALHKAGHLSEYSIYGVFVDEVLKPSNLTIRAHRYNLMAWDRKSFDHLKAELLHSRSGANTEIALVIQSNIGIPATEYEDLFRNLLNAKNESW